MIKRRLSLLCGFLMHAEILNVMKSSQLHCFFKNEADRIIIDDSISKVYISRKVLTSGIFFSENESFKKKSVEFFWQTPLTKSIGKISNIPIFALQRPFFASSCRK